MNKARVHLIIEGRVQGVFFRESARRRANALGIFGWVRNLPDGSVEALAEGHEEQVEAFVAWCHDGPPSARIDNVRKTREEWNGEFDSFDVVFY